MVCKKSFQLCKFPAYICYIQFIVCEIMRMSCFQSRTHCICKLYSLPPAEEDLVDIAEYLTEIGKAEILKLGLVLGLSHHKIKALKDSDTFLSDVIAAWLRKEDYVKKKGEPSWSTLVNALKHCTVKQEGIANKIAVDKTVEV